MPKWAQNIGKRSNGRELLNENIIVRAKSHAERARPYERGCGENREDKPTLSGVNEGVDDDNE
jgi:hypothetical protein